MSLQLNCEVDADNEPISPHVGRYDRYFWIGLAILGCCAVGALAFVAFTWNLPQ